MVNGVIQTNYSLSLKEGDLVEVCKSSIKLVRNVILDKMSFWPIPPQHMLVNYRTLQIMFGDIKNSDFSNTFKISTDLYSVELHCFRY